METQVWSQVGEKSAYLLTLRGTEVNQLKVTGSKFSLKKNLNKVLEALAAGQPPAEAGAKVISSLDAREIKQVEVSPGNGVLMLEAVGSGSTSLNFSPTEKNADKIWDAIHAQTGRRFHHAQVEVGVVDAISPAVLVGVILGGAWGLLYYFARQVASGEEVELGRRRRGIQRMFLSLAENLGTGGSLALGVVLLLLIIGWAARRIVVRPLKTVWAPSHG